MIERVDAEDLSRHYFIELDQFLTGFWATKMTSEINSISSLQEIFWEGGTKEAQNKPIQKTFLTDLQKAKWIVLQTEKAKKEGREINFDHLVTKAQTTKPKRKRPKKNALTTPEKE